MGWGIKLTEEQWNALDRLRFTAKSADVFRNCVIVLMSDSSQTIGCIAEHLGCATDTVVRVRRLYRKEGIEALRPIKPPGRPGRATPKFIGQMRQAVLANPITLGYGFSTWSVARLAAHLAKTTGICFGTDQLARLLHRHGFSFQRPKHTMKGKRDEAAYEKSTAELKVLKKKRFGRTPPKPWCSRTRWRFTATRR
jgi:transposase